MKSLLQKRSSKILGIIVGIIVLLAAMVGSVVLGLTKISWSMVLEAYTQFNQSNEHLIITTARVPRALIAAAVGASLAISGALMQALTRNPLASPGIFGVNAGAGFFIVLGVTFLSMNSISEFMWLGFLGALIASGVVYFLGFMGNGGLTPLKLTLAGAAITALFSSLTQGLLVVNEQGLDQVLYWLAGSVEGRKLEFLAAVLPYMIFAWVGALFVARPINLLMMGDDVAKGLGQRTALVRLAAALIIVVLAGGAVAIAGPVGFIGLVTPHMARALVGHDYRWVIPYSAILGAVLLLVADIGARYIIMPKEVPVGVMTALIGTPFFIYIARKGFK